MKNRGVWKGSLMALTLALAGTGTFGVVSVSAAAEASERRQEVCRVRLLLTFPDSTGVCRGRKLGKAAENKRYAGVYR